MVTLTLWLACAASPTAPKDTGTPAPPPTPTTPTTPTPAPTTPTTPDLHSGTPTPTTTTPECDPATPGFVVPWLDPDTGVYADTCAVTTSVAEVCAQTLWRDEFGGTCPDLPTFLAAARTGTRDPDGARVREVDGWSCETAGGRERTWLELRSVPAGASQWALAYDDAGSLVTILADWGPAYGDVCCSGRLTETQLYGEAWPAGTTCTPAAGGSGTTLPWGGSASN